LVFLRIGLFAIGGAYSFLPLIEKEAVERYQWLTREEFLDVSGLSQIFPGAISVKFATYTGYKVGGIAGALSANFGLILGPAILIILASIIYAKYKDSPRLKGAFDAIRIAVFAMIIAVAFRIINLHNLIHVRSILLIVLSFSVFLYTKIHPAVVIILVGILGAIWR